jgi:tetratricopeptide (TPR) repeat protein
MAVQANDGIAFGLPFIPGLSVPPLFDIGAHRPAQENVTMKLITTTAIAIVAAIPAASATAQMYGGTAPPQQPAQTAVQPAQAAAPASAQPKISISKGESKAFVELQKAVNANDVANIPAKLAAAQAVATTKEDHYAIGQLQLKAALAAKDNNAAANAVDAIAGSGFLDGARTAELYDALGVNFYNAKDFARASSLFERAAAADPRNPEPLKLLAEARNASGQGAQGAIALQKALQLSAAAGQKPGEDLYKRALGMAYDAKSPSAIELGREWVAAYPGPDSWTNSIAIYRNMMHPDVGGTLDLLRLMRAAGALTRPGDYALYATAAADQGNFAEAQSVIDEGIAAKRVEPASAQFRDIVSGLKAKPKATGADLAAATKMAPTAKSLIGIGDRYYGLGEYAKAVEVYRQAIAKGGDANLANLHIGMALARAGDKAGAAAALNSVTGPQSEIAKFWLIYVQRQA